METYSNYKEDVILIWLQKWNSLTVGCTVKEELHMKELLTCPMEVPVHVYFKFCMAL